MLTFTLKRTLGASPCGHMTRLIVEADWDIWDTYADKDGLVHIERGDVVRVSGRTYRLLELVSIREDDGTTALGLTVVEV